MIKPLHLSASLLLAASPLLAGCDRRGANANAPQAAAAVPALAVRALDSPAGADSREPELFPTADGRVILSWVEKRGEKRHALKFAARDAAGWSEARTAAADVSAFK